MQTDLETNAAKFRTFIISYFISSQIWDFEDAMNLFQKSLMVIAKNPVKFLYLQFIDHEE